MMKKLTTTRCLTLSLAGDRRQPIGLVATGAHLLGTSMTEQENNQLVNNITFYPTQVYR